MTDQPSSSELSSSVQDKLRTKSGKLKRRKDDRAQSGIMDTSTADFILANARYNGQVLQLKVSPHTTWEVLRQQVTICVYFEKARLSLYEMVVIIATDKHAQIRHVICVFPNWPNTQG